MGKNRQRDIEEGQLKILGASPKELIEIRKEVEPRLQAYEFWRQLISNPPTCNQCGSDMTLQKGQKSIFLGCGNFPSCKNKQWLTQSHQEILRRII